MIRGGSGGVGRGGQAIGRGWDGRSQAYLATRERNDKHTYYKYVIALVDIHVITYVNRCHQRPVTIGIAPCMNERAIVLANFHFRVSMNCLLSMIVLQELVCSVLEFLDLLSNVTLCVVCIYM